MSTLFVASSAASQVSSDVNLAEKSQVVTSQSVESQAVTRPALKSEVATDSANQTKMDSPYTLAADPVMVDNAKSTTQAQMLVNPSPVNPSAVDKAGTDPSSIASLASMLGGLVVVLLIIFFLAYLVKRFNLAPNSNGVIKTIAASPLGQKEKLMIVEVEGRQYLLGVTPHQVNLIDKLETPIEQQAESFASRLRQAKSNKS